MNLSVVVSLPQKHMKIRIKNFKHFLHDLLWDREQPLPHVCVCVCESEQPLPRPRTEQTGKQTVKLCLRVYFPDIWDLHEN